MLDKKKFGNDDIGPRFTEIGNRKNLNFFYFWTNLGSILV